LEATRSRRGPSRREHDLLGWIRLLADKVGPRRPTGAAERRAAQLVRDRLRAEGLEAELEQFAGYSTFAAPFGLIVGLALAPALFSQRRRLLRSALATAAAGSLAAEGGLLRTPISDALSRGSSQNVVATVEPSGEARRTVCLVCHLDTSRSGLLFDPRLIAQLNPALTVFSLAVLTQGSEPLLGGFRAGRRLLAAARLLVAAGAALLAERELRGEDVPGANDNASGVAVVAELALELAAEPLPSTRVIALMTGCEESGLLGAQAFLRSRDTSGWLFVNFDSVGGPGTLRYARREGIVQKWDADPALIEIAERIAAERPELDLHASEGPIGLTYDVSPVLARGGRGLTFVAGDGGVIPNYHWPSDTPENLDPEVVEHALEAGRDLLAAIERGDADRPPSPPSGPSVAG